MTEEYEMDAECHKLVPGRSIQYSAQTGSLNAVFLEAGKRTKMDLDSIKAVNWSFIQTYNMILMLHLS